MRPETAPRVSVAIPLFASKRFVSCIAANIEAIDYPNVEILVSDRHCLDDSVAVLRRRFRDDPRITFIERTDGPTWVDHYNGLLGAASGRYFMWMPHDDSFPSSYIPELVAALEASPEVVLAFGCIDLVTLADEPFRGFRFYPPPFPGNKSRGRRDSIRLLFWGAAIPFRGVFRRDVVVDRGLLVRPCHETVGADAYWVFGLSMVGHLEFVPSCRHTKRKHLASKSASSGMNVLHVIDGNRVLRSYIRELSRDRRSWIAATAGAMLWSLAQLADRGSHHVLPKFCRPFFARLVCRLLPLPARPGLSRYR